MQKTVAVRENSVYIYRNMWKIFVERMFNYCFIVRLFYCCFIIVLFSVIFCGLTFNAWHPLKTHTTNLRSSPSEVFLRKGVLENMRQIYRRTSMPKCDFSNVAKQLYWNRTSAWVFSCKPTAYFQNTFS